ncbi:hypothetical protein [Microbacterium sp. B19]|uniref:hypothetical protein n=1 Tax=Microbacterium sp. B19 TaxID=96765 RepID=UPI0003B3BABF|nr:hypothetical protein [Microbacterium sp. B19]
MIALPPYPKRASSAEVRQVAPSAYRVAAAGVVVLPCGVALLLLAALVQLGISTADWLDGIRGLVVTILFWSGVVAVVIGVSLLQQPAEVRRGIALSRFGREAGLEYVRSGGPVEARGVFFTDGAAGRTPVYQSEFELRSGPSLSPDLRLGVATFRGNKNDPRGPRPVFRFLELRLPRPVPHVMIDSLRNGRLREGPSAVQRLRLEGDVDRHFAVYAPRGYERDALQLLTPDVLICLIDHGRAWDVEIVDDRVIVASTRFRQRQDATEVPGLLRFALLLGAELRTQVAPYTDPRAENPRTQVSAAGRRLRRRSMWWQALLLIGIIFGTPALILGVLLLIIG